MRTCPGHLSEPARGAYHCSREIGCLVGDIMRKALAGDAHASVEVCEAHSDRELFHELLVLVPQPVIGIRLVEVVEALRRGAVLRRAALSLCAEFLRRAERLRAAQAELNLILDNRTEPI